MEGNIPTIRAQEPATYTCALCDSEDGVRWFCNDCRENLCDQCKDFHQSGKKTKNDDIVSIWEVNHQGHKPKPEVCKLHPGKLCDVYCSDCYMLLCMKCVSQTHKQHKWKHFEDEFSTRKQLLEEHMKTICSKITFFQNKMSTQGCTYKAFTNTIGLMKNDVGFQRERFKAEVDSVVDALLAELSVIEKEEATTYQKDYQHSEKNIGELTRLLATVEMTDTWSMSMIETEMSLRTTLPSYDVNVEDAVPKLPSFVTGHINRLLVAKMVGELNHQNQYQKIEIGSRPVQPLSKFTVHQQNHILGICPVDNYHAWLSIHQYKGLVLVNREGIVSETIELDFCPYRIAMVGMTSILMTSFPLSSCVYKLSLLNKQVTTFSDIRLCKVNDISINRSDAVFVMTDTSEVVVLNPLGTIVRSFRCGINGWQIACLSSGDIAVSDMSMVLILAVKSGTTKYQWTGELNNDQKIGNMILYKMSCDQYDRFVVPDFKHNLVYVIPGNGTEATCLLDNRDDVVSPTVVGVDMYGKVWIGCGDGTVHVMQL